MHHSYRAISMNHNLDGSAYFVLIQLVPSMVPTTESWKICKQKSKLWSTCLSLAATCNCVQIDTWLVSVFKIHCLVPAVDSVLWSGKRRRATLASANLMTPAYFRPVSGEPQGSRDRVGDAPSQLFHCHGPEEERGGARQVGFVFVKERRRRSNFLMVLN